MLWLSSLAFAASLPGIDLPFDVAPDGRWILSADLPEALRAAGVTPGWILIAVDDQELSDGMLARKVVANGPARDVRLRFQISDKPGDETIILARRAPLVGAEETAIVAYPDGFAPVGGWSRDDRGNVLLVDASGARRAFDTDQAAFVPTDAQPLPSPIPSVFWSLATDPWVVDREGALEVKAPGEVRSLFEAGTHVPGFRGRSVDTLLLPTPVGVQVYEVEFPSGTPALPWCSPRVPETCLASGRAALATLGDRPGASELALEHLSLACTGGVNRACFEALAVREPESAAAARACTDGDLPACSTVSTRRFEEDRAAAQVTASDRALTLGLLEFTCDLEGSGTLSERLRRIEDVGAACAQLSEVYDALDKPDYALLALDRSCVLGRAEACDAANARREDAYASKTVRECEDPQNPIAPSCVDLGKLLRVGPVPASSLDEFGAFLRGCSLGSADGCLLLGDYVDRWGIENPRVIDAETTLRASCSQGEVRSCLGAAHLLVRHEPRSVAYGEALTLFASACEQGLGAACIAGAEQRRIGQARVVPAPDAVALLSTACDRSDALGCEYLGQRLAKRPDTTGAAYTAWTRSCDLGVAHACSELGVLVATPHEAWSGELSARDYLVRGCDDGDPEGCFRLAEYELPKKGEPPEPTYVLLSKSCEGEFAEGCARLAEVHLDRDTSFDEEIAAGHLDTACANGSFDSCKGLGTMYLRGRGVEKDRKKAKELLERFRLNAPMRYVRVGVQLGLPAVAGGELELALPSPGGIGLSIAGAFSQLPTVGAALPLLAGGESPDPVEPGQRPTELQKAPTYRYLGATVRLYPNPRARGLYGFGGVDQITAFGGYLDVIKRDLPRSAELRNGFRGGIGLRNDQKRTFSGLEAGIGYFGQVLPSDFDEDSTAPPIPLLQTVVAVTFGLAPF